MRLRVGILLCLFAIIAGVGCRKALAPNVDRNKAPETWITAAPFDTITLTKGDPPPVGTIPIRFHVYWAGSDHDGAVVGYYWAVVDTLPLPEPGGVRPPPLPGPRPTDYHFTTRTDTTFIFQVAEDIPDRQHAFFIYAVDDKGKPDPTPARFIFNALDRYPPLPVFDMARATGKIYFFQNGVLTSETRSFDITDSLTAFTFPSDTVPSGSRLTFRFHGEPTVQGGVVEGFRYRLDEPVLQPADEDSLFHGNVIEYNVPPAEADPARGGADVLRVPAGTKVFTLRAVDQAKGSRDATRRFQMNFSPDTWVAGPDPDVAASPSPPGSPWVINSNGEKYALLDNGRLPAGGLPGTLMNSDSVQILPSARTPRKTFLEIYGDTVFLRREGDTVHLASWVVFHSGGFDRDSPYEVRVVDGIETLMPSFPGGPVLTKAPPNGSPIGFRSRITNFLSPNGPLSATAQSSLYPLFDPNDVLHFPRIGAYHAMFQSGKAYSLQRAEDGDLARDGRVEEARQIIESPRNAYEQSLQSLITVFYVNYPPVLQTDNPIFRPRVAEVDTFYSRNWDLRLPADDRDPYVSGDQVGGPSPFKTIRLRFTVTGLDLSGNPLTYHDPALTALPQKYLNVSDVNLLVPDQLATGPATLTIEICDCALCEAGEGRCVTRVIPVYYVRPSSASGARTSNSRPGLR